MPVVIAHRGASTACRENTLEAFRMAADLGADAVELDVRRTADDVLVIHHDPILPDGRLLMAVDHSDLPSHVPTLAAALDACGEMWVNVEIKNLPFEPDFDPSNSVVDAVVALLTDGARTADVVVSSFNLDAIDRVRHHGAGIRTGFLVLDASEVTVAQTIEHGHEAYHPWNSALTSAVVDAAHRHGLDVNTWTVDDPDRIAELTGWGVDGIVTNTPDVARAVIDSAEAAS